MTRASGYYWVRYDGQWRPAYWFGGDCMQWEVLGESEAADVQDTDLAELGPRLEAPT